MHVDDAALLARLQRDYPHEYEVCALRCWVDVLEADNARLRADAGRNAGPVFTGSAQATNPPYDPLTGPLGADDRPAQGAGFLAHDDPPQR